MLSITELAGLIDKVFPQADTATPAAATNTGTNLLMFKQPGNTAPEGDSDPQTGDNQTGGGTQTGGGNQTGGEGDELNNGRDPQPQVAKTETIQSEPKTEVIQPEILTSEADPMQQIMQQTMIEQGIDPNDPMALLGGTEAVEAARHKRQETAEVNGQIQNESEQRKTRRGKRSRKRRKAA